MDINPSIIKTIKRLSEHDKPEVLKNKLRYWLVNHEFTILDLLYSCKDSKTIQLSSNVLNKLAFVYSQGKEGVQVNYNYAFLLFEYSAELGNIHMYTYIIQYLIIVTNIYIYI